MQKKWKIILIIGCIPFLVALLFCFISSITATNMSFMDYLLLYSVIYWPTYVIGLVLIILSIVRIKIK